MSTVIFKSECPRTDAKYSSYFNISFSPLFLAAFYPPKVPSINSWFLLAIPSSWRTNYTSWKSFKMFDLSAGTLPRMICSKPKMFWCRKHQSIYVGELCQTPSTVSTRSIYCVYEKKILFVVSQHFELKSLIRYASLSNVIWNKTVSIL